MDIGSTLLERKQLKPEKVQLSETSFAYVARLTANERDLMETQWLAHKGETNVGFRAFVVAFCLCDENNKRLCDSGPHERLKEDFAENVAVIGQQPIELISPLFNAAGKINGILKEDIDELEKN